MKPSRRRPILILPDSGTILGIPLANGLWRASVLDHWYIRDEKKHTPLITLYDQIGPLEQLQSVTGASPLASLFTTGICLTRGLWPELGMGQSATPYSNELLRRAEAADFIGVPVYNENIVEDFSNALAGLIAWNIYKDPMYFDKLLAPGVARPPIAWYKPE